MEPEDVQKLDEFYCWVSKAFHQAFGLWARAGTWLRILQCWINIHFYNGRFKLSLYLPVFFFTDDNADSCRKGFETDSPC
jgi:hypothetical protein